MPSRLGPILVALAAISGGHIATAQTALSPEEIMQAWRISPHADSKAEAFRHWDTEGEIPGTCAVCHSTPGIVDYLSAPQTSAGVIANGVPIGTTVECAACHNDGAKALSDVLFPTGQRISTPNSSAICSVCHQGRTSMDQVDTGVAGIAEDSVSADIRFINIHYAAAASTQLGSSVRGGYQYAGRVYKGVFAHVEGASTCVSCHGAHDTQVTLESCTACHKGAADFRSIRTTPLDILGTGETGAGIGVVVDTIHQRLLAAIMVYARDMAAAPVVYASEAYPYFFNDLNANGAVDEGEAVFPNAYRSFTPRLLKAAYNYQFVGKDQGAFAHNPHYAIQLLIDSIENLAEVATIDTEGLARP